MSAYMVDDAHIDAMVDIAKQYESECRGIGRGQFYWHFGNPGPNRSLRDQTETEIGRNGSTGYLGFGLSRGLSDAARGDEGLKSYGAPHQQGAVLPGDLILGRALPEDR